jgi:hypothetical protein
LLKSCIELDWSGRV